MRTRYFVLIGISLLLYNEGFAFSKTGFTESSPAKQQKFLSSFSASTTFTNKHLWRSFPSGSAPCIEPTLTFNKGSLNVSAWAAFALDNSYQEVDLYATYDVGNFQFGIYDYYCPVAGVSTNEFLQFSTPETKHSFELQAIFKGIHNFPLRIMTACFIAGDDLDVNHNQRFSSYVECSYTHVVGKSKLSMEIGLTPYKGMYASKASVFNYGLGFYSNIRITEKWDLPVSYKLVYNKELNDVYFSVGFVIR